MKTIICGGRDYRMTEADHRRLNFLKDKLPITEVVSGAASGADREGEVWARLNGIPVKTFPAEWTRYGKSAGPRRNADMASYADACIAFPGGRGTADMVCRAREKFLMVFTIAPPHDMPPT